MSRRYRAGVIILLAAAWCAQPVSAQEPTIADLRKEIQALAEAMKVMQKDMADIKALLQQGRQPQAPQNVVLDLGSNPSRGERTAKLTLVEFTDYQCPFCSRYARDTYPQIQKEYVETGNVRYVLLDMPLESIHKSAFKAAEAASCAGEQRKYWEMHDRMFANQQTLDGWTAHAEAIGLDAPKFEQCLASGSQAAEIRGDMNQAKGAGVTGTPGFFLAVAEPGGTKVRTVQAFKGAQPFANFKDAIDKLLAQTEKDRPE